MCVGICWQQNWPNENGIELVPWNWVSTMSTGISPRFVYKQMQLFFLHSFQYFVWYIHMYMYIYWDNCVSFIFPILIFENIYNFVGKIALLDLKTVDLYKKLLYNYESYLSSTQDAWVEHLYPYLALSLYI